MTNHSSDTDLQLRIFPRQDAGYPVEITLGRHQVFPRPRGMVQHAISP